MKKWAAIEKGFGFNAPLLSWEDAVGTKHAGLTPLDGLLQIGRGSPKGVSQTTNI
jgi:hypothetical protein